MTQSKEGVQLLLQKCRYEDDLDNQVATLLQINSFLPSAMRLNLPSFFTDDYVRSALDMIEEKLFVKPSIMRSSHPLSQAFKLGL